mgnify:CR=1 FL=1
MELSPEQLRREMFDYISNNLTLKIISSNGSDHHYNSCTYLEIELYMDSPYTGKP